MKGGNCIECSASTTIKEVLMTGLCECCEMKKPRVDCEVCGNEIKIGEVHDEC